MLSYFWVEMIFNQSKKEVILFLYMHIDLKSHQSHYTERSKNNHYWQKKEKKGISSGVALQE